MWLAKKIVLRAFLSGDHFITTENMGICSLRENLLEKLSSFFVSVLEKKAIVLKH